MTMSLEMIQSSDYTSADTPRPRIVWAPEIEDLHVNLVSLNAGEEIGTHSNQALDVLITVLNGSGLLTMNDENISIKAGSILVIRKGAQRRIVASSGGLLYTTCHRKRGGIMPTPPSRR